MSPAPRRRRTALVAPPPLPPGARVALVAPAGPLRGPADLDRAIANATSFGWIPVVGPHALDRLGYFAGTDADRRDDLAAAIADPTIDGIWCLRGGYGAMRLLDTLDLDLLRHRPKPLLGYSDITALHAAVGRIAGIGSLHAPTARAELTPFTRASLERAVRGDGEPCGAAPTARILIAGSAEGRLAGGNLALVTALVGTPWFPDLDGAILVLEDINEAVYRVDRMLQQLRLAGALDGVVAIAFGACTGCPPESDDGARALDEVLREHADQLDIPCVTDLPFGHIDDQWTLPLGALATLDATAAGRVRLTTMTTSTTPTEHASR